MSFIVSFDSATIEGDQPFQSLIVQLTDASTALDRTIVVKSTMYLSGTFSQMNEY